MLQPIIVALLCVYLTGSSVDSRITPIAIGKSPKASGFKDVPVPRPLTKSQGQGGLNGTAFDDLEHFNSSNIIFGVHSISISSGDVIDSIEVVYILSNKSLIKASMHGKPSETPVNITLEPDETIVKIEGKTSGQLVNQLTITTVGPNYVKVYGPFGKTGSVTFSFEGQIIAFHGRSGDSLDKIGVYSLESMKRSDQFGESIGTNFDDYFDLKYPPVVKIKSINVWSDVMVQAFQVEYILLDGSTVLGERHGFKYSTNLTTITLAEDENLTALEGKVEINLQTAKKYIGQLTFTTSRKNGLTQTYGPFGVWGRDPFRIPGNILGFHGRSGALIYKIGTYYI